LLLDRKMIAVISNKKKMKFREVIKQKSDQGIINQRSDQGMINQGSDQNDQPRGVISRSDKVISQK